MLIFDSPCKVNLLLNILGKREDGYHELETVMQPVPICDRLHVEEVEEAGVRLTCDTPHLKVDGTNLVHAAAALYLEEGGVRKGVRLHLEKKLPLAAGLGGGSSNAARTLLGLNQLFEVFSMDELGKLAARLGSDVPFFLQDKPALARGRGEQVESLAPLPLLEGRAMILVYPGFGVSTGWAYRSLERYPQARAGKAGQAAGLIAALEGDDWAAASPLLFNSLEAPVLDKYPILEMYQEFFLEAGAFVSLMSGSGSTTFAIGPDLEWAKGVAEEFGERFGRAGWVRYVRLGGRGVE